MYLGMLRAWYEDRVPTKKQKTKEYQKKQNKKVCQRIIIIMYSQRAQFFAFTHMITFYIFQPKHFKKRVVKI